MDDFEVESDLDVQAPIFVEVWLKVGDGLGLDWILFGGFGLGFWRFKDWLKLVFILMLRDLDFDRYLVYIITDYGQH